MHSPGGGSGWERLFRLVFSRSSNPIALLDERRCFVEVNDPALALLGRSREQVLGTSVLDSIRPAERPAAMREWDEFLDAGEYSGRRALLRGDGSESVVDFAARLADVGGRRVAIFVVTLAEDSPLREGAVSTPDPLLTSREREVVTQIALGRETSEIAGELHISAETVRTHVRNAMSKLGAHTRAQLVAIVLSGERALQLPQPEE